MSVTIQDSYGLLRSEQIEEFEREFRIALPSQYRDFLLAHNGGSFADSVWFANELTGAEVWIEEFYGLDCSVLTSSDLRSVMSVLQGPVAGRSYERIPGELIPVADSPGGQLCLGVSGKPRGSVFWWDMEEPAEDPYDNTILCADSFDSFLAGLTAETAAPDETVGGTPFAFAEVGNIDAIDRALRDGFELDARDGDGRTMLLRAARRKRVLLSEYLIQCGANVNAKDDAGLTALHLTSSADVVKVLLRAGAEVDALDRNGCSPLMRAVQFCRGHIVHLLLAAGANPLYESSRGSNAISLCHDTQRILPMLLNAAGHTTGGPDRGDPIQEAIRRFDALQNGDA